MSRRLIKYPAVNALYGPKKRLGRYVATPGKRLITASPINCRSTKGIMPLYMCIML
jgi:hypothetical protein